MKKSITLSLLLILSINLTAQNWQDLPAENDPEKRHENAFVKAGNKLLLIGGRGEKPIDIYNLEEKNWNKGQQPPLEIHHFQAVYLDGLVYVLGALTGNYPHETPLKNVLIYDPAEDFWHIGPEIPENRRRGAAGVSVYEDKIYISNGIINGHNSGWVNWFDEFDPYKNQWKKLANSPRARDHFQSVVVDDKLVVAGGRKSGSVEGNVFSGTVKPTDIYDFSSESWTAAAEIPTPRAGTAATIFEGKAVILGGESMKQKTSHNEVEAFNVQQQTWNSLSGMKNGRHGTQAITLNNQIIIGAGSGNRGGGPELDVFEIYTSANDPDFSNEKIISGELKASAEKVSFSTGKTQEIIITNTGGNQAKIIRYIQIDNTSDFRIKNYKNLPQLVAPGSSFTIEVEALENGNGNLLIKHGKDKAPLSIILKN